MSGRATLMRHILVARTLGISANHRYLWVLVVRVAALVAIYQLKYDVTIRTC